MSLVLEEIVTKPKQLVRAPRCLDERPRTTRRTASGGARGLRETYYSSLSLEHGLLPGVRRRLAPALVRRARRLGLRRTAAVPLERP